MPAAGTRRSEDTMLDQSGEFMNPEWLGDPEPNRTAWLYHLKDAKGIYGIELRGVPLDDGTDVTRLIYRPDRLGETHAPQSGGPIFQRVLPRPYHGRTLEYSMAQEFFYGRLRDKGLDPNQGHAEWWSDDPAEQAANRRKWHGLKWSSFWCLNRLIGEALEAAAPPDALKAARRFRFRDRFGIYRKAAASRNFAQLADTFPVVACHMARMGDSYAGREVPSEQREAHDKAREAGRLIETGAKLRVIAACLGFPMTLRHIKPGAIDDHESLARIEPRLIETYLPKTTRQQVIWLGAVDDAMEIGGPYVDWVAANAVRLGATADIVRGQILNIADWVQASYRSQVTTEFPEHLLRAMFGQMGLAQYASYPRERGRNAVSRPFTPGMSQRTVIRLSGEWHEAVALADPKNNDPLPPPWRPAARVGELDIVPLASAAEIAADGRAMHHCAATYIEKVRRRECYLYSAREGDKRTATIEVVGESMVVSIRQMTGPCNAILPRPVQTTIYRWLRQKDRWTLPKNETSPAPGRGAFERGRLLVEFGPDRWLDDNEIPF